MKKMSIWALTLFIFLLAPQSVCAAQTLIPGGQIIGLELGDETVTVAAFENELGTAAKEAGLRVGDRITHIDGCAVKSAVQIRQALDRANGSVRVTVNRNGNPLHLTVQPHITPQGPRLGIYLKNGVTGVGTVTWYDPDTGKFGALGHAVNDSAGQILQLTNGKAYDAKIISIKKGKAGDPGQLMGALDPAKPMGILKKNTVQGIFGTLQTPIQGEPLPIAQAKDIRTGNATIRCSIQGEQIQEYSVKILKLYPNCSTGQRNMLLKITDPTLLHTTGGIVQGMSGSPIIQDGKLVGAVTHVLVNDPTTGYGIFIENMLDAAA